MLLRPDTLDDKSTSDCRRNRAVCSDIVTTHYMAALLYLYTLFGFCLIISHINFTLECAIIFRRPKRRGKGLISFMPSCLSPFLPHPPHWLAGVLLLYRIYNAGQKRTSNHGKG